jgi:hypothetical protein
MVPEEALGTPVSRTGRRRPTPVLRFHRHDVRRQPWGQRHPHRGLVQHRRPPASARPTAGPRGCQVPALRRPPSPPPSLPCRPSTCSHSFSSSDASSRQQVAGRAAIRIKAPTGTLCCVLRPLSLDVGTQFASSPRAFSASRLVPSEPPVRFRKSGAFQELFSVSRRFPIPISPGTSQKACTGLAISVRAAQRVIGYAMTAIPSC